MAMKDKFSFIFSIVATIISMVSLSVSIRSCRLEERVQKLHLKPELTCILDHDLKQPPFFLFVLKNVGSIDAVNVSVRHYIFAYLQSERKIRASFADAENHDLPGSFIFNDALRPNQYIQKQTGGYRYGDSTVIYIFLFDISFFRESDGELFQKRCTYYVDGQAINSKEKFRVQPHYKEVTTELARVMSKDLFIDITGLRQKAE